MKHPFEPYADKTAVQDAAADAIEQCVRSAVADRGVCRISLSGGSTPRGIYERLGRRDLPWSDVHWFWGDERNVPPDHADSNQAMVRQTMLTPAGVAESHIHPVPTTVGDPHEVSRQYESVLRDHFDTDWPRWDLMLLGMGDDAHTASLFPGTDAIDQTDRWFVENHVPQLNTHRYTLTYPAINSAREIWFLITGEAKREALTHVLGEHHDPHQYPSQLIQPTRWFVSKDAVES